MMSPPGPQTFQSQASEGLLRVHPCRSGRVAWTVCEREEVGVWPMEEKFAGLAAMVGTVLGGK